MSADQIIGSCWWYLEHVHLFLIPAAIFDICCWIVIAIFLRRRGTLAKHWGQGLARGPRPSSASASHHHGAAPVVMYPRM